MAKRRLAGKTDEINRCRFCGEGIGPGIRPHKDQHASPEECFKALKSAVHHLKDVIRELVAGIDSGQTRVIKATFAVEPGSSNWSITVTDPLGNEDRMAQLVAHTLTAIFTAAEIRGDAVEENAALGPDEGPRP